MLAATRQARFIFTKNVMIILEMPPCLPLGRNANVYQRRYLYIPPDYCIARLPAHPSPATVNEILSEREPGEK